MSDSSLTLLTSAATGLLAGTIASLIAPWVHWGIEKKRNRLEARRRTIQEWREAIKNPDLYDRNAFRLSAAYSTLRPFLSREMVKAIEDDVIHLQLGGRGAGPNNFVPKLLDRVSELERKWKLI